VELGEIEAVLGAIPGVREAAVTMRGSGAEARLLAHYAAAGDGPEPDRVRAELARRLPDYMVPAAVVRLPALPRTRTDKIDRRALPSPAEEARRRGPRVGPGTDTERRLAPLWRGTLALDEVDVHEGFFEAGGNSLLAIRLVAAVRRELGAALPVAAVFRAPTLAGLARLIEAGGDPEARSAGAPDGGEAGAVRLVSLRSGDGGPALICFPGLVGGVAIFAELAAALPAGWSAWAVPLLEDVPSTEDGIPATARACAAAVAAALPSGPVHLLGWSYGAHVAFETARRLEAAGRDVGLLALVDAPAAGGDDEAAAATAVPDRRREPEPEPAFDPPLPADLAPEDAARWLAGVAARSEALARHRPEPWSGSAVVIRGTDSVSRRDRDSGLGWSRWVRGRLDVEWSPGSHESLLSGEGARAVAAVIERHAAAARRETP
jgi:thioesterase domain-containing protein